MTVEFPAYARIELVSLNFNKSFECVTKFFNRVLVSHSTQRVYGVGGKLLKTGFYVDMRA